MKDLSIFAKWSTFLLLFYYKKSDRISAVVFFFNYNLYKNNISKAHRLIKYSKNSKFSYSEKAKIDCDPKALELNAGNLFGTIIMFWKL